MSECRYCGCGTDRRLVLCIDCDEEYRTQVRGLRAEVERLREERDYYQAASAGSINVGSYLSALEADVARLRKLCREAAPALEAWADEWSYYDEDYEHGVALARRLRAAGVEPGTDGGE